MKCPECKAESLSWEIRKSSSGLVNGRLNTHEVRVSFVLGCEYCSETIKVVSSDDLLGFINLVSWDGSKG